VSVHDVAAVGFGSGADAYERARPTYPAAAVAWLTDALALRAGTTVADVAAGTGKLTRLLGASGATVLAVEPVGGMREQLVNAVPGVPALGAVADATKAAAQSAQQGTQGLAQGLQALAQGLQQTGADGKPVPPIEFARAWRPPAWSPGLLGGMSELM
jgi:hypothetical protein